jgi:hypothetical protein
MSNRIGIALLGGVLLVLLAKPPIRGGEPDRTFQIDGRVVIGDFNVGSSGAVVDGPIHEGVEIDIDLPSSEHVKNFGAPKDNLGLCVFASMNMAAHWHNVRELADVIHKIPNGGGYPAKVDKVFKDFAPNLKYVQYEGTDPAILDKALSGGRPACVTYGYGERYKLQTIFHMVMLVHLDKDVAVILDNNFPGTYEWMSRAEFLKRWVHPGGQGWAFVMLAAPPPPVPTN